jgi:hypothetical protein
MTRIIAGLVLLAGAGIAEPSGAQAQSAYDHPYCAVYADGDSSGARSCYYTSYAQCMATMSGIGGYCIESPYYRPPIQAAPRERRRGTTSDR